MNFAVYAKKDCPHCDKIKKVLELTESKFVVYTLGTHFTKDAFIGEFGEGSTFPQVICNGTKLGGAVDTIKFLQEQKILNK
tara:strand:+ start:224 stop:466 length:243 start_codon:yes stop_codon:yes gene_type:complete